MPICRKEESPGVARRERNQAVILQSWQPYGFIVWKDLWQESTGLVPAATPGRRFEGYELTDEGLHAATVGTGDSTQQLTSDHWREPYGTQANLLQHRVP